MARILTGIQSSGVPHLGNILGAIIPGIELSKDPGNEAFFFIADLHSLTSIKDGNVIRENTYAVAAAWLAFGFDTDKNVFYRQSDIPEVCELTWYLNCFTPYPMLANAHSFKDKSDNLADVNAGLFDYPVLMAADILLYDAEIVPVGKDQQQHLEITRDIAQSFNHKIGQNIFILPEAKINEKVKTIPGIDGRKMSKSYNNYINIFTDDKTLRKQIMRIVTDSQPLEAPKDPDSCNVFKIFSLLATPQETESLRKQYLAGGFGYGQAKQWLYEIIVNKFENERKTYHELMQNRELIDEKLKKGADKARTIALKKIKQVRSVLGY
ncbi:MAG: tryptophan--tRNA ligase [Vicingaceae bacterium]|nr:MAG: tryptophan--tRNA ligase [Vicingaceae bacterium]